jgi:regulatory protein
VRRGVASRREDAETGTVPPQERALQQVRQAAFIMLGRRDMAEEELRQALLRKGHPESGVEPALDRLRRERYIDDGSLAARYARSRMEFQGQGQHRVRQGLRRRGVAGAIIEQGLREALGEVSERDVLDRQARRYWAQRQKQPPARRLQGLWAFLLRRGFPAELVGERLRALWPRWSDALDGLEPGSDEERS